MRPWIQGESRPESAEFLGVHALARQTPLDLGEAKWTGKLTATRSDLEVQLRTPDVDDNVVLDAIINGYIVMSPAS